MLVCGKMSHKHPGHICIRPAGHLIEQHHSATGKYWGPAEAAAIREWTGGRGGVIIHHIPRHGSDEILHDVMSQKDKVMTSIFGAL